MCLIPLVWRYAPRALPESGGVRTYRLRMTPRRARTRGWFEAARGVLRSPRAPNRRHSLLGAAVGRTAAPIADAFAPVEPARSGVVSERLGPALVSGRGVLRSLRGSATTARRLGLGLIGLALGPVLLDQGLRDVAMLATNHPEDRRRPVLATGHGTVLNRRLLARTSRRPPRPPTDTGRPTWPLRRAATAADSRQHRVPRPAQSFHLDGVRQLLDELAHDISNGPGTLVRHLRRPPLYGRAG